MKFHRILLTALRALRRNIVRALLTMLGVVIGVAAVIAMMEIGNGSTKALEKIVSSMGANTVIVLPGAAASGGISFGSGSVNTLTPHDAERIGRDCPAVAAVAPVVSARTQVVHGSRNWVPHSITGTTPDFLQVRAMKIEEGEPFTDRDVRAQAGVCLVGKTIVRELFAGASPIGREIRMQNTLFRVIGVLESKGANMMGMDQDDIILAPWTTIKFRVSGQGSSSSSSAASSSATRSSTSFANQLYPAGAPALYPEKDATQAKNNPLPVRFTNVNQILVSARDTESIPAALQQVASVLRSTHRIGPGETDDFTLRDMTEMTKTMGSTTRLMTNLLLCVAMISLVVGGVGIMNIMLVSVTERTREIGLRMAVGAESGDILRQFLLEAVLLCVAGGILGILLGRLCSTLVTAILNWPTAPSLGAIIASFLVSAAVGVIFGYYPAWKASKLDPIEALRYE